MSNNRLSEPNTNQSPDKKKTYRWIRRLFIVLAMALLISVITSNFFYFPMYDEAGKSMVMAEAAMFFTLSTVFGEAKSK